VFQAALAVPLPALHMTVSQAGPNWEHDAMATVLIIGASRGIGLETVKAALEAGHSVRALAGQPEGFLLTMHNWKKWLPTRMR
jgi:NADPH:quinone reductase-like Zn-dependent oxidoreductase